MSAAEQQRRMAQEIVNFEARRDRAGDIQVYYPPSNDGGGAFEVAGINVRYHAAKATELRALILAGKHAEAERLAVDYLLAYTGGVTRWHPDLNAGVEFYLRDSAFNRGPTGAAKILQIALGFAGDDVDGDVGFNTKTRLATAIKNPEALLNALRTAREQYELKVAGKRANLWGGLVNRWDKALVFSLRLMNEPATPVAKPATTRPAPKPVATPQPQNPVAGIFGLLGSFLGLFIGRKPVIASPAPAPAPTAPATAPKPATAEPAWMIGARADIGFKEKGVNGGIENFVKSAKTGKVGDPYCAIWVNAKVEDLGIKGSRSPAARSFEESPEFVKLAAPAFGCIVTQWRGSPTDGRGHVFFYTGEHKAKGILGVGANENDSIREAFHPDRHRVTGYWWPKSVPLPKTGVILVADNGEPIVTSEV